MSGEEAIAAVTPLPVTEEVETSIDVPDIELILPSPKEFHWQLEGPRQEIVTDTVRNAASLLTFRVSPRDWKFYLMVGTLVPFFTMLIGAYLLHPVALWFTGFLLALNPFVFETTYAFWFLYTECVVFISMNCSLALLLLIFFSRNYGNYVFSPVISVVSNVTRADSETDMDRRTDMSKTVKLKHKSAELWNCTRTHWIAVPLYGNTFMPYYRGSPHYKLFRFNVGRAPINTWWWSFPGWRRILEDDMSIYVNMRSQTYRDHEFVVSLEQAVQIGQIQSLGGLPKADAIRKINIWGRTPSSVNSNRFSMFENFGRENDRMENARIFALHMYMDYADAHSDLSVDF